MLQQLYYVVTYITHTYGGTAQFAEKVAKQGKVIINVVNLNNGFVNTLLLLESSN